MKTILIVFFVFLFYPAFAKSEEAAEKLNPEPYTQKDLESDLAKLDKTYDTEEKKKSAEYASLKGQLIAKALEAIYHDRDCWTLLKEKKDWILGQREVLQALWDQGGKWGFFPMRMYLAKVGKKGEVYYASKVSFPDELKTESFVSQIQYRRDQLDFRILLAKNDNTRVVNLLSVKSDKNGLIEFVEKKDGITGWIFYINCPDKKLQKSKLKIDFSDKSDILISTWFNGQKMENIKPGKTQNLNLLIGTNSFILITQNQGKLEIGVKLTVKGKDLRFGTDL